MDIKRGSKIQENIVTFPQLPPDAGSRLPGHHLPTPLTPLIGREQEVSAVSALLQRPEVRLVTLRGAGGVGKTRLALQVATDLQKGFVDGVSFISLAPLRDPDLVVPTIAHALGLTETGDWQLLERLYAFLREKHVVLVLDNFEQVATAAPQLSELLEACPDVKILVTSREALRLRGEHQFAVLPLALPDLKHLPDDQSLAHVPSVNLFLQRAQAIRSDFQFTTDNAATIAEICLRLDGLPLAIELAAARLNLLSPQALLARLGQRLAVLTSGTQDAPVRQQTLRNTIEWSYQLLDAQEQRLFRRLSAFVGGCTLEAIEAVCVALDKSHGVGQVLDGVASLIDKSLLQRTERDGEEPRVGTLETLREYGLEALATCGEIEDVRRAHAMYCLALAEKAAPELEGPQQAAWLQRLAREHDNLRAAMRWSQEQVRGNKVGHRKETALRLSAALRLFWQVRGYLSEGRSFLEQALTASRGIVAPVRAKALTAAANLALYVYDDDQAERLSQESLALCRELGVRADIAFSLLLLGQVASTRGNSAAARMRTEEAWALFREVGEKDGIAWALFYLAEFAGNQGEYARARALFEESLVMLRELGNKMGIAWVFCHLAWVLIVSQSTPATAHVLLEKALTLFREVGDKGGTAQCLFLSGQLALCQSDEALARRLIEESMVLNREIGSQLGIAESLAVLAQVEASQGDLVAARALYRESLTLVRKRNYKDLLPSCLEGLGGVVAAQGELAWAARLYGAAESLRESVGTPIQLVERATYDRSVASTRTQLGEQAFDAAWAEGRTMTPEHVLVSLEPMPAPKPALTASSSAAVAPLSPAGLTPREMDVLRLLAQGLTSTQIAERLVVGVVTVNSHVRSIYSKLEVTSRSAATRYAMEHHLL